MRSLTLQEVDDIIYIYKWRQTLPEAAKPYFDWWVDGVSRGTIKVIHPSQSQESSYDYEVSLMSIDMIDEEITPEVSVPEEEEVSQEKEGEESEEA